MQITYGAKVTLNFSLTLSDGTVAFSTYDDEPISFVLGDGSLEKTLELAILGLRSGENQTLTLDPGQAFGMPDPESIISMPRSQFPDDMQVEPGTIIEFTREDGEEVPGTILHADKEKVSVDFNHPFAGHTLEFTVDVLDVEPFAGEEA